MRGCDHVLQKELYRRSHSSVTCYHIGSKVEAIIRYSHIYSGAYYNKLASQFEAFKEATDDYSFGFMELYTIAALGVSLHSPTISESNFHTHVLGAMERQINCYFENSANELYQNLLNY